MNLTESQITQKSQECFDFWFKDVGVTGHNHGYMSKSCFMFEHVLLGMLKPASGHFMQMGTNFGVSFDILYRQYGNRCIGIDLWNPLDHPNIIEKDIYDLEDMNLGFCNVDAGDFTWTNYAGADYASSFVLRVKQDGTGGRSLAWPAGVDWGAATAPELSTAANAVDIYVFLAVNNLEGSIWYGFTAGQAIA